MPKTSKKGRGWFGESVRHALAARGLQTAKVTPTRIDDRAVARLIKQEANLRKKINELVGNIVLLKEWEKMAGGAGKDPQVTKARKEAEKQLAGLRKQHTLVKKQMKRLPVR